VTLFLTIKTLNHILHPLQVEKVILPFTYIVSSSFIYVVLTMLFTFDVKNCVLF